MRLSLSLHAAPCLLLFGLGFLQDVGHNFRRELERELHIPSKLLGLASFGIGNPEKVHTCDQGFCRANEIANALFVLGVLLNQVLNGLIGKHKLLALECQALEQLGPNLLLQDDLLVRRLLSRAGDDLQTIPQNRMHLALVIKREHEQAL